MDPLAALRLHLDWGADEALGDCPVSRFTPAKPTASDPAPQPSPLARAPVPASTPTPFAALSPSSAVRRAAEVAAVCSSVSELETALRNFDGCPLSTTATNLAFAAGEAAATLVLIGECPGADEDRTGKPFAGPRGALLRRMLASIDLDLERLLSVNLVPWRPPGNRLPSESEITVCRPFLDRLLTLVRPRHIVLLGNLPTRALVTGAGPIRRMRGRWTEVAIPGLADPVPALPMLSPDFLFTTPLAKREAWADLLLLQKVTASSPTANITHS